MDERLRFVARLLDGEKMTALCREFAVSRKTGYKIFERYKDCGLEGLTDRSRRPYRQANQLPFQIEKLIVQLKRERPSWGAPKIREKLSGSIAISRLPLSALCTRCSIVTAWSTTAANAATRRRARRSPTPTDRTISVVRRGAVHDARSQRPQCHPRLADRQWRMEIS